MHVSTRLMTASTSAQAVAPALQLMGESSRGHVHQSALQLRLACIAAAPWGKDESSPTSKPAEPAATEAGDADMQDADDGSQNKKVIARALFAFAWQGIFEVQEDMPQTSHMRSVSFACVTPTSACIPRINCHLKKASCMDFSMRSTAKTVRSDTDSVLLG